MAKLSSSYKNMLLSLLFICLLAAGLLAKVNDMTKEPIADAKALKLEEAIKNVVPEFDNNPVSESYKVATDSGDSLLVYPAKKGDDVVGFAVNSYSDNGFSGNIQVMVGFDMENNVVDYAILSHAETPGLGSQMVDWFKPQVEEKSLIDITQADILVAGGRGVGCVDGFEALSDLAKVLHAEGAAATQTSGIGIGDHHQSSQQYRRESKHQTLHRRSSFTVRLSR